MAVHKGQKFLDCFDLVSCPVECHLYVTRLLASIVVSIHLPIPKFAPNPSHKYMHQLNISIRFPAMQLQYLHLWEVKPEFPWGTQHANTWGGKGHNMNYIETSCSCLPFSSVGKLTSASWHIHMWTDAVSKVSRRRLEIAFLSKGQNCLHLSWHS